jgi:hypothetical protein
VGRVGERRAGGRAGVEQEVGVRRVGVRRAPGVAWRLPGGGQVPT